jgi:hypothetical protein
MNKLFLTAALCVWGVPALAQGTFNFANAGIGFQAKVTDTDGVTGLSGSAWSADLYWALGTVTDSTLLTALNEPTTFSTVPAQAGYFFGNTRTVLGTQVGETITAQVRVWDTASGSSWATAAINPGARVGESILFQVGPLGGYLPGVPAAPANMTGLGNNAWSVHVVAVPEPSTVAFAGLGLAGMLVLRHSRFSKSIRQYQQRAFRPQSCG